jgi:Arc/MetJ-type ribon-helix-helix transcriptional regulator
MRKSVNFGKKDKKLIEHFITQNKPFSTFVKELIREDMKKESLEDTIKRLIKEYVKVVEEPKEFDELDIDELKRFMGE